MVVVGGASGQLRQTSPNCVLGGRDVVSSGASAQSHATPLKAAIMHARGHAIVFPTDVVAVMLPFSSGPRKLYG